MSQDSNNSKGTLDENEKNFETGITLEYQNIVNASYNNFSNSIGEKQHVNILMDYPWTIDKFIINNSDNGFTGNVDIPHCYAVEYKQLHNSTITNLINTLTAGIHTLDEGITGAIDATVQNITELYASLMNSESETPPQKNNEGDSEGAKEGEKQEPKNNFFTNINETFKKIKGKIIKGLAVTNGIRDSAYLKPYSLLYWLQPTGKQYVFPMIANPPSQNVNNSYDNSNQQESFLSTASQLNALTGLMEQVTVTMQDLRDVSHLFTGSGTSFRMSGVEKAKFFQYPTETEEYTIQFPLINTIRGNNAKEPAAWIKNYDFIVLFCLKNMIFRKDNAAFYPPLFYDLVIPGVIRQPFCYVSSIQVTPRGMIKQKELPTDILSSLAYKSNKPQIKQSISVPEQWHVTIKFKSLLATSANMVLSSMFDLGIEAQSKDAFASGGNMGDTRDESIYNNRSTIA